MSPPRGLAAVAAGFAAGIAGGLFGVGGGIVMIPLMTGRLGLTQHQAHGTSLAVIGITALFSLGVYGAHGNVAWRTAAMVALGSIGTARLGARLAQRTSSTDLTRAFWVMLMIVGVRLLFPTPASSHAVLERHAFSWLIDVAIGLGVGLLSGYMGVGGGILAVPAFTLLLGMPQQLAQGTSLAVILVAAPVGAIEHARHGSVVFRIVPALALGAAAAAPIASWIVQEIPHAFLTRAFAVFLIANGVRWWARSRRSRRPAEPAADTA